MTRLTRADIKTLFENDPPSNKGISNKKVGQWQDLDAAIRRAVSARKPGQPKPSPERLTFTRTDLKGGRAVTTHGETDVFDVASKLRGAKEGHASAPTGTVVYKKHEGINSYYNQLRESCSQYLNDEVVVKPENYDPSYGIAARKFLDSARVASANNMRRGAKIAGPIVSKVLPGGNDLVKAGAELQAGIIEPKRLKVGKPAINSSVEDTPYFKQLKEAWWCGTCNSNEDTMTGDIGSVAVPFVAPGETEEERKKKRKKRRKLGVVLAAATGSVQGIGN